MSNNIIKEIRNDSKIKILKLLNCDEKYINGRASDFEWFALWEEALFLAEGHKEVKAYEGELTAAGLSMPDKTTYSRRESISRWRRLGMENNTGVFEGERIEACSYNTSAFLTEKYKIRCRNYKFDVNKCVTEIIMKNDSVTSASKMLSEKLENDKNPYITLVIDINNVEFLRPDPYLAGGLYEKEKSGEKLNMQEKNVLLSQLLIELLIRSKNTKAISILIKTQSNSSAALGLVAYLARRGIFEGEIAVTVDAETDLEVFADIAAEVYPKIWLRPFLDAESKKLSDRELSAMFSVYPSGAFLTEI